MKSNFLKIVFLFLFVACPSFINGIFAVGMGMGMGMGVPTPCGGPFPPCPIPLDSNVVLLLLAGAGYGGYKLYSTFKKDPA